MTSNIHLSIEAVWRIDSAKIIARLTRILGDINLAEELTQDVLMIALEQWLISGVTDKPGSLGSLLIQRGLTALERLEKIGQALGSYALQAAIAAEPCPGAYSRRN